LAQGHDDRIGFETEEVIFRDGRRWHFDKSGRMVARIRDHGLRFPVGVPGSNHASCIEAGMAKNVEQASTWYTMSEEG